MSTIDVSDDDDNSTLLSVISRATGISTLKLSALKKRMQATNQSFTSLKIHKLFTNVNTVNTSVDEQPDPVTIISSIPNCMSPTAKNALQSKEENVTDLPIKLKT